MSKLDKVLDEYHKYLTLRKLCKTEHAPYLVGWVKQFLRFANDKTGHKLKTVDSPRKNTKELIEKVTTACLWNLIDFRSIFVFYAFFRG